MEPSNGEYVSTLYAYVFLKISRNCMLQYLFDFWLVNGHVSSFHTNFANLAHKLGLNGFKITDRRSWGLKQIDDIYFQGQNHSWNPIFMGVKKNENIPVSFERASFRSFSFSFRGFRNEFPPWIVTTIPTVRLWYLVNLRKSCSFSNLLLFSSVYC